MLMVFNNERTYKAVTGVLEGLPAADFNALHRGVALATDDRVRAASAGGDVGATASVSAAGVIFIDSEALKAAPIAYVAAVVAHEFAHTYLGHHRQSAKALSWEAGELAADRQAVAWGFASLLSADTFAPRPVGAVEFGKVSF